MKFMVFIFFLLSFLSIFSINSCQELLNTKSKNFRLNDEPNSYENESIDLKALSKNIINEAMKSGCISRNKLEKVVEQFPEFSFDECCKEKIWKETNENEIIENDGSLKSNNLEKEDLMKDYLRKEKNCVRQKMFGLTRKTDSFGNPFYLRILN